MREVINLNKLNYTKNLQIKLQEWINKIKLTKYSRNLVFKANLCIISDNDRKKGKFLIHFITKKHFIEKQKYESVVILKCLQGY